MNSTPGQILEQLFQRYPALESIQPALQSGNDLLTAAFRQGGKLLVCGNGGSAADSEHIAGELMKGFRLPRPVTPDHRRRLLELPENGEYLAAHLQEALPCIAITGHTALSTAIANDTAADMVFAQQIYAYGRPGDCLIGISTSGNAGNVCNALLTARALGMHTIGLSGGDGGRFATLCDVLVAVPATETYLVQEYHLPIYHAWCSMLEATFFGQTSEQ